MRVSDKSEPFVFYVFFGGIAALVSQLLLIARIVNFGNFFYVFIVVPLAILSVTSFLYLKGRSFFLGEYKKDSLLLQSKLVKDLLISLGAAVLLAIGSSFILAPTLPREIMIGTLAPIWWSSTFIGMTLFEFHAGRDYGQSIAIGKVENH